MKPCNHLNWELSVATLHCFVLSDNVLVPWTSRRKRLNLLKLTICCAICLARTIFMCNMQLKYKSSNCVLFYFWIARKEHYMACANWFGEFCWSVVLQHNHFFRVTSSLTCVSDILATFSFFFLRGTVHEKLTHITAPLRKLLLLLFFFKKGSLSNRIATYDHPCYFNPL